MSKSAFRIWIINTFGDGFYFLSTWVTHTEQMDQRLKKVKVPALLVWGNLDVKQPVWMATEMQQHLENSNLVTVFGGHTFRDFLKLI